MADLPMACSFSSGRGLLTLIGTTPEGVGGTEDVGDSKDIGGESMGTSWSFVVSGNSFSTSSRGGAKVGSFLPTGLKPSRGGAGVGSFALQPSRGGARVGSFFGCIGVRPDAFHDGCCVRFVMGSFAPAA